MLAELPSNFEPELAILIHTYRKVCQNPYSLPPQREHDHEICLQQEKQPVKVRPYRYLHS